MRDRALTARSWPGCSCTQNGHAPWLVSLPLFSGAALLSPVPWGTFLGHPVTGLQAGDLEQVPGAELAYTLLRSDGARELPRRPHPAGRLAAVVAVPGVGPRALRCSATLLPVRADSAPPGGEVALVPPPPPPPPDPGGRDPLGGAQRRDPRGSLTFPGGLGQQLPPASASGCRHRHCDLFLPRRV